MDIDIGIDDREREQIASRLSHVLADTYGLYLETHAFHWNVTGPMFRTLHVMFEEQYRALASAVDEIAERIRALGFPAPGSYREFMALSSLPEDEISAQLEATEMIRTLVVAHETVVRSARNAFGVAESAGDHPTCDLLTARMRAHEKTAWMLRSLVETTPRPSAARPAAAPARTPRGRAAPPRPARVARRAR